MFGIINHWPMPSLQTTTYTTIPKPKTSHLEFGTTGSDVAQKTVPPMGRERRHRLSIQAGGHKLLPFTVRFHRRVVSSTLSRPYRRQRTLRSKPLYRPPPSPLSASGDSVG
ncbi:proline-rich receptor-like protein kinase PERK2 [Iris pallida]|uniref:Proline-rich receptor-like protein kinase PERK2 n=1 Tax=Iris pallida TaxID=29817 RepID=A0AAX6ESB7_IRIPA|nr:proline-rich receptor-like protein kinase PERK2 [Iris pallida]KAJ6831945.1 proline-rich receptor-like protein kinase PERK2 [Iris pallida]